MTRKNTEIAICRTAQTQPIDFVPIRKKLLEIAAREKQLKGILPTSNDQNVVQGEGNEGRIERSESKPVQLMKARLRLLHYPISTERAYLRWLQRFIQHVDDERLERYGEPFSTR